MYDAKVASLIYLPLILRPILNAQEDTAFIQDKKSDVPLLDTHYAINEGEAQGEKCLKGLDADNSADMAQWELSQGQKCTKVSVDKLCLARTN